MWGSEPMEIFSGGILERTCPKQPTEKPFSVYGSNVLSSVRGLRNTDLRDIFRCPLHAMCLSLKVPFEKLNQQSVVGFPFYAVSLWESYRLSKEKLPDYEVSDTDSHAFLGRNEHFRFTPKLPLDGDGTASLR
ncbi:hypothetical protein CEXT_243631 [Caerostris extrusa]|uniref:Aminotransferase-like plant mobile domain-containing protein n=1 Tax=Caerostris extrusa TaxID=172846 RepID=A0AAV4RW48_CAEEX|nr:hypothetical protein CEXT_243631 [Caerostris extrusa]